MAIKKKKGIKITIDKLAVITQNGFVELENKLTNRITNVENKLTKMVENKFDKILKSEDKVMGELQIMREEHAASFGLYKRIEERTWNHEKRIKRIEEKINV